MDGERDIAQLYLVDPSRVTEEVLVLYGGAEVEAEIKDQISDVPDDCQHHVVDIQSNHTSSVTVQYRLHI